MSRWKTADTKAEDIQEGDKTVYTETGIARTKLFITY
jgi:hypothetical protein